MNPTALKQLTLQSAGWSQVRLPHTAFRVVVSQGWRVLWVALGVISLSSPGLAQTTAPVPDSSAPTLPRSAATVNLQLETPAQPGSEYALGDGDSLQIDIFSAPDYSGEYKILNDGTITMPLVGTVFVRGLTLPQITADLSQRYSRYFRVPNVTVRLLNARPIRVAISGEINRPGVYVPASAPAEAASPSNGANEMNTPTVTSIIQLAGGITQSADIRNVQVYRQLSNGEETVLQVNLWQILENSDLSQDLPVQAGDRIVVPTAASLTPEDATALASTSFSPTSITVNVVGEVQQPGAIQVPPNTPLNQALLAAGGFNPRAKRDSVNFIRLNPNGTVTQREIEIDLNQQISDDGNPPLRNNDTILVRRSGVAAFADNVNPVLTPITGFLNIFRLFGL